MRITRFELLKIITNKLFIVAFLILWVLNLLFLNYQNYSESKNEIPYEAYKTLEIDLKSKSMAEKGKYIDNLYERAKAINIIYNIQSNAKSENQAIREYADSLREENKELYNKYYEESKNPTWKYTGNGDTEWSFLESIKNDYNKVSNYQGTINDILEEAETQQNVSIFKTNDEVSLKSITKTADTYKDMKGIKTNYEIGEGIKKISNTTLTDFFVLILIFIISTILITEEKDKNLFTIIKSTKNGNGKTIMAKIMTLFIGVLLICLLFYGTNYIYYLSTLGCGNIFANIQSVPLLMLSTLKINILEYLFILFGAKVIFVFLLSMIMFYLSIKFNNTVENIFVFFIIILVNFIIYQSIDPTSSINIIKSFNLISLLNTNEIFRIYDNLKFYNILVSKTSTLLVLEVITIILFIILSFIKYLKSMNITIKENVILEKIKKFKILKNIRFNSIFSFETYKLLFVNKGFFIIILFAVFTIFNFRNQNYNMSYNEMFYKNYMDILSGDLTPEKETLIKNTLEEYDKAEVQLALINERIENGEITNIEGKMLSQPYEDILATREIFNRIEEKYDYIKENSKASFVYDTGYNKLFRVNTDTNENDIYLIVITIIILTNLFIMEYRTGFIQILNATKKGRKKTAKNKIITSLLTCTFIYIISIIPEILGTLKMYGLENLSDSIISLGVFHSLPASISILSYLIMFYIVRYVSYILLILIILYISLKLKNMVFAFITSIFVLLIPIIISALKIAKSSVFPLMNLSIIGSNILACFFVPAIVIISIFLYNSIVKRLE